MVSWRRRARPVTDSSAMRRHRNTAITTHVLILQSAGGWIVVLAKIGNASVRKEGNLSGAAGAKASQINKGTTIGALIYRR